VGLQPTDLFREHLLFAAEIVAASRRGCPERVRARIFRR
jgi:hypothetical protein